MSTKALNQVLEWYRWESYGHDMAVVEAAQKEVDAIERAAHLLTKVTSGIVPEHARAWGLLATIATEAWARRAGGGK